MESFQLTNDDIKITLLNYGARIIDFQVRCGETWRPIVLRYPKVEDYVNDPFYLGAICGPYANRIANGYVDQDNIQAQLSCNDGKNHLHGGFNGLDKQYWHIANQTGNSVTLRHQHEDSEDGYPGPMVFEVTYSLLDKCVTLNINCRTDSTTILGPTGHAYFNLNGIESQRSGLEQYLQSDAKWLTPFDTSGLPNGEERAAKGSELDFEHPKLLSTSDRFVTLDNNYVFEKGQNKSIIADAQRKLFLSVSSDYPAVQLYTGSFLDGPFTTNQGICIEPHFGANAPNRENNFDWTVMPGKVWHKTIQYQLSTHF